MTREDALGLSARKRVADALTLSRLPLALLVFLLGASFGRSALGAGLILVLVGWTTDILDGRLARSDPSANPTAIGEADLAIDLVLDTAGLYLFVFAGLLPWLWSTLYFCAAALVISLWPKRDVITWFELPVLALHPVFAFVAGPAVGWIYLAWLAGAALLNLGRLADIIRMLWKSLRGKASDPS